MALATYQALYQYENRAVELTLRDKDMISFTPDSAYAEVVDEDDTVIMAEQSCTVSDNTIYIYVGTTVTNNPGTYYIIWKIIKDVAIYYHKTTITIEEI